MIENHKVRHALHFAVSGVLQTVGYNGKSHAALALLDHPMDEGGGCRIYAGPREGMYGHPSPYVPELRDLRHLIQGPSEASSPSYLADYLCGRAIAQSLGEHREGEGWRFFSADRSVRIEGNLVFGLVALRVDELDAVPHVAVGRAWDGPASLVHALIRQVLYRFCLHLSSAPDAFGAGALTGQQFEVTRTATANYVSAILGLSGSTYSADPDLLFNSISALPYEGRSGIGSILAVSLETPDIQTLLKLRDAVPLRNVKAVRKLMEASGSAASLLLYDAKIYGFGRSTVAPDAPPEDLPISINVESRGGWELRQGDRPLLRVQDGVSQLPVGPASNALDQEGLEARIRWLIPGADIEKLLVLAKAAEGNRHGAMLIVSANAAQEAMRFTPQSWAVDPVDLSEELLVQLTSMDGGVLLDDQGRCHAIGVILDGIANGEGEAARGSRFNNPIRYLGTSTERGGDLPHAVVVVYSADGAIDILPSLPRCVPRAYIDRIVRHFLDLARDERSSANDVLSALDLVKQHSFYLTSGQCDALNDECARISTRSLDGSFLFERLPVFAVNPRMDEDRFFCEDRD